MTKLKKYLVRTSYTSCNQYVVMAENEDQADEKWQEGEWESCEELPTIFDANEEVEEIEEDIPLKEMAK